MDIIQVIVVACAVLYFYAPTNREKQKWWFVFACMGILFCSCYRSMALGYDTESYVQYFNRFRNISLEESLKWQFEPGYILLNKGIGYFTDDGQIFLSVLSFFTLIPIFYLMWNHSENPLLSLFIFVSVGNLFSSYAALRQWCAVAVLTWGFQFIVKRRMIPFLVTVALGYTFHQSALFVLPLYFLYPMKITRQKLLLCAAASVGTLLLADQIMKVMNLFARLETNMNTNGGYILLIVYWGLVIVIEMFATPIENGKYTKLMYMALLYSAIVQPMCLVYSSFARIHLYTWFGMALGIPALVQYMDRNYDRRNSFLLKFGVTMVMVLWYYVTEDGAVITLIL